MTTDEQGRARDEALALQVDDYPYEGCSFQFTGIQAVLGFSQPKKLAKRIDRKRHIVEPYRKHLERPCPPSRERELRWQVDILTPKDAEVEHICRALKALSIA